MLGRDSELFLERAVLPISLHDPLILSVQLLRVHEKLRAVIRQRHTSSAAVEQRDPKLLLELLDRAGERGLGYVQLLSRLIDRSCFRYSDDIV